MGEMGKPRSYANDGYKIARDHRDVMDDVHRDLSAKARVASDEAGPGYQLLNPGHELGEVHFTPASERVKGPGLNSNALRNVGAWGTLPAVTTEDYGHRPLWDFHDQDGSLAALFDDTDQDQINGHGFDSYHVLDGRHLPDTTPGFHLAGTDGLRQATLFMPDHQLVADHRGEGAEAHQYSTPVYDIFGTSLDQQRAGGLHSLVRNWQLPNGGCLDQDGYFVPALNFSRSTDRTGFGAYVAEGDAVVGAPLNNAADDQETRATNRGGQQRTPLIGAFGSATASGPWHPGHESDKHRVGANTEGGVWNVGHIQTGGLFYMDQERDAPLDFSRVPYPECRRHPIRTEVTLSYDIKSSHSTICGRHRGLWRWHTTTPILPPPERTPPTDKPPRRPPTDGPPPDFPLDGEVTGGGPGGGDGGERLIDFRIIDWNLELMAQGGRAGGASPPGSNGQGGATWCYRRDDEIDLEGTGNLYEPAHMAWHLAGPGMYWTAGRLVGTEPYLGDLGGESDIPDGRDIRWMQRALTMHAEGFGAVAARNLFNETFAAGELYAKSPTCDGGVFFAPAEVKLDAHAPSAASDGSVVVWNGLVGTSSVGNGVKLGSATPDLSTGGLKDGWYLQATGNSNAVNADLRFVAANGSARIGALNVYGDIIPGANNTYNLGSSSKHWNEIHATSAGTITDPLTNVYATDGNFANDVTIGGKLTVTGAIDPTGLILDPQSSTPCGEGEAGIWVRSSDGALMFTAGNGTDYVVDLTAA